MPHEVNEAAMAPADDKYRVSLDAVLDQYKAMYSQAMYDLALSRAGVEELLGQNRDYKENIRDCYDREVQLRREIEDLTAKLDEVGNLSRQQGQIIERYRLVHGNPPMFADEDSSGDDCTDGRSAVEVEDEVFQGKAQSKVVSRKR